MKTYKIQITIEEGRDEFWEEIKGSGCDEVVDLIRDALIMFGGLNDAKIELIKFTQEDSD